MQFGKIRIKDGEIIYPGHMMFGVIPCREIVWAYHGRESSEQSGEDRQVVTNSLVIVTDRPRTYRFAMTEREAVQCIQALRTINPDIVTGYPRGMRVPGQNLYNTRDLGAFEVQDGRHILPCRLLRSAELYHLSVTDKELLTGQYHIRTVIDLRSAAERRKRPDDILPGVEYHPLPLLDETSDLLFQRPGIMDILADLEGDPEEVMRQNYVHMVRDPYTIGQLARIIETFRHNGNGAVLWHCSNGKDRTDLVTAVLMCVLGVDRDTIIEEFLRTRVWLEEEKNDLIRLMSARGFEEYIMGRRIRSFYEVKASYLESAFEALEKDYGSMDRFLKKALFVTPRIQEELRDKYLI
ncbi:MAG: tyrosine-protein phosphatase [Blautia sp.]|nr:tyrosine-protein phosphatase [Blautia sp.]